MPPTRYTTPMPNHSPTAIELAIFISRVEAICWEMGAVLRRVALSPNIKDRLDFSCALFDRQGELFAQAAHIPVHLGSMAYAMKQLVGDVEWQPGDVLVVNDPYLGGTHLPDVTLVSPIFDQVGSEQTGARPASAQHKPPLQPIAFVANRAHHANIGADSPGSMPISTHLDEEGILIPPTLIVRGGEPCRDEINRITSRAGGDLAGDFAAQMSANRVGAERYAQLVEKLGLRFVESSIEATNRYGERLARSRLKSLPAGTCHFRDLMDDDGCGAEDIAIKVAVTLSAERVDVDFRGTAGQVSGNLNCPLPVTAAAVFYAVRCILPAQTPACAGAFNCINIRAEEGSLVNARRPAAVAAGNVETSMRIVDVVLGALAQVLPDVIPAASQGTMNNVAMGNHRVNDPWDYYETMAGGTGGTPDGPGVACVHSHMTNTLNTPVESIEMHYPLRVREYSVRRGSGGAGLWPGGDGLIRELEFLADAEVTLLSERRRRGPWGLAGGGDGQPGANLVDGKPVPGKCQLSLRRGQVLRIESPGGGAFGAGLADTDNSY